MTDVYGRSNLVLICRIYVKDLLAQGVQNGTAELHPLKYSVVRADNTYRGEIKVGLTFTPRVTYFRFIFFPLSLVQHSQHNQFLFD